MPPGVYARPAPIERFWAKVDKTDTCWLWTACTQRNGYGVIAVDGKRVLAHRFAYSELVAPIAPGAEIDHLCGTRNCVNPEHLRTVDHATNMARGYWATKTHCRRGHPYTETTTSTSEGHRRCLVCRREADRRRRPRKGTGAAQRGGAGSTPEA